MTTDQMTISQPCHHKLNVTKGEKVLDTLFDWQLLKCHRDEGLASNMEKRAL